MTEIVTNNCNPKACKEVMIKILKTILKSISMKLIKTSKNKIKMD